MAESTAELQAEWWSGWWDRDFSWEGLAKKPVGRNALVILGGTRGERNLQTWWRHDPETGVIRDDEALRAAGELLRGPDGRDWHIAHVPLRWQDGTAAKDGWDAAARDRLAAVIGRRVAAATETATDIWCRPLAPDGRAQLSGVVLWRAPVHLDGPARALHAVCDWALLPSEWGDQPLLGAGFRCDYANFSEGALFDRATFSGDASFSSATFSGNARFSSATFSGNASFSSATFSGDASFHRATFSGNARFSSATFSGDASFYRATFSGNARFSSATFSRDASFSSATFSRDASFAGGECVSRASFRSARFLAPSQPGLTATTRFRGWRFNGVAEFDGAVFEQRMEFTASVFARLASFQGIQWPKSSTDAQGLFSQAVFKDLASFQGAGLRCFAAFDGAVLQGGLQLDDADERTANATFQCEREEAEGSSDREAALRRLEGGCRVLKQAMEKSANKTREQMFYAFELMARRHQRATPWWERQISRAYGALADYGRSIGRPLLWLAVLIPVFAAAYMGLLCVWRGGALAGLAPRVVFTECLSHSFQRVLPFGPWALTPAQIAQSPVQSALNGPTDALFSLALRFLGSLQSLLALILAFLAGLAIRRRFQIN